MDRRGEDRGRCPVSEGTDGGRVSPAHLRTKHFPKQVLILCSSQTAAEDQSSPGTEGLSFCLSGDTTA